MRRPPNAATPGFGVVALLWQVYAMKCLPVPSGEGTRDPSFAPVSYIMLVQSHGLFPSNLGLGHHRKVTILGRIRAIIVSTGEQEEVFLWRTFSKNVHCRIVTVPTPALLGWGSRGLGWLSPCQ